MCRSGLIRMRIVDRVVLILVILDLRIKWRRKHLDLSVRCILFRYPLDVRLLKCPKGEEIASDSLPERFTREETSFSCDHTEKLLWRTLTGRKGGKELGTFLRTFLNEHLGL